MFIIRIIFILLFSLLSTTAYAAPKILFTDILSGPNTGGKNNNGVFLCVYGTGFGSTQGTSTVKINNTEVTSYEYWGASDTAPAYYDKICIQPGPSVSTGAIKVTVNGEASNTDQTFTVRSGNIYFVDGQGTGTCSGDGSGTYADPWTNPNCAVNSTNIIAGDIVYFRAGTYSGQWGYGGVSAVFTFRSTVNSGSSAEGTVTNPIAFLGYPGEDVYLYADSGSAPVAGIRFYYAPDYYVFAGFRIVARTNAFSGGSKNDSGNNAIGTRFVGNNTTGITVQSGGGSAVIIPGKHNIYILGNRVHGSRSGGNLDHAVYLQACSNYTEIAYNHLYDNDYVNGAQLSLNYEGSGSSGNCSNTLTLSGTISVGATSGTLSSGTYVDKFSYIAISGAGVSGATLRVQIQSKSGNDITWDTPTSTEVSIPSVKEVAGEAHFYNNYIDCSYAGNRGIYTFEQYYRTGDPTPYPITYVYNNIWNSCGVPTNNGVIEHQNGNLSAYNNSMYNSSSYPLFIATSGTIGVQANVPVLTVKNNIMYSSSGVLYHQATMPASVLSFVCDHNLFYGNGSYSDSECSSGAISSDPLYTNTTTEDFTLQSGSPAKDAGTTVALVTKDFDGLTRPQNSVYDIGAYEYEVGGCTPSKVVFTTDPVTATEDATWSTQPVVTIQDSGNNTCTNATNAITLTITTNPGSGTLSCTTNPLSATSGVATFSGCSINNPGINYVLTASASGLTSDISAAFTITNTCTPSKVVFTTQPGGGYILSDWSQQPITVIQDSGSVTCMAATNATTLAIGTNPGGGTLSCMTNPVSPTWGVATFSGCDISAVGTGYTLTASASGLTGATSSTFDITSPPSSRTQVTRTPQSRSQVSRPQVGR